MPTKEEAKNAFLSLPLPFYTHANNWGLLHHQGNVASPHWLISTYHTSHWSICQLPIKYLIFFPWLALEASLGLKTEHSQRPSLATHSGVACFSSQTMWRQRATTGVSSFFHSGVALYTAEHMQGRLAQRPWLCSITRPLHNIQPNTF